LQSENGNDRLPKQKAERRKQKADIGKQKSQKGGKHICAPLCLILQIAPALEKGQNGTQESRVFTIRHALSKPNTPIRQQSIGFPPPIALNPIKLKIKAN
jgi:hypothetical protein